MFKRYYEEELTYLHDLGREFARAYPDLAPFLSHPGSDPDVERLLEGTAFLTSRLRQKLDDELPELTHELIETFFPHYLRPLPAMTMMRFEPLQSNHTSVIKVPVGTAVDSVAVEGTTCRFRTTSEVVIAPVELTSARLETGAHNRLRLRFQIRDGVDWSKLKLDRLRILLSGEVQIAKNLLQALVQAKVAHLEVNGVRIGPAAFIHAGLTPAEALLPHPLNAPDSYRTLLEYFAFPEKFLFVELTGLEILRQQRLVDVIIEFTDSIAQLGAVTADQFLLNCSPAINLFTHDGDPIMVDHRQHEYKITPSGGRPSHYEVYSIARVEARNEGIEGSRSYQRLLHFSRTHLPSQGFYAENRRSAIAHRGSEVYLSFTNSSSTTDVISLTLQCTNGHLPEHLRAGDIRLSTPDLPQGVSARNLTKPRPAISPILDGDLHWRLLRHLNLSFDSLVSQKGLRSLIDLYDLPYLSSVTDSEATSGAQAQLSHQRLCDGILNLTSQPTTALLDGIPICGVAIEVNINEDRIGGSGEAYLLGTILNDFFAQFITLNSFSRLTIRGQDGGVICSWPACLGRRRII
jgi:type VI secretion system protein ImpG